MGTILQTAQQETRPTMSQIQKQIHLKAMMKSPLRVRSQKYQKPLMKKQTRNRQKTQLMKTQMQTQIQPKAMEKSQMMMKSQRYQTLMKDRIQNHQQEFF
mmetsp:Transcript_12490/g.27669  ORF Transcript_12490/g.27669 Transcript_12490/m.27669 type:complete len:100 (-) Transcript_12490:17-316(-)